MTDKAPIDLQCANITRRSFLRGTAALSGLAAAVPLLAACGSTKSSASTAGGALTSASGSKTIGLSLNGLVEYDKQVAEGVAKVVEASGYKLKVVQANFTDSTELSNLQSLLAQGVAGLVILPNTIDNVLTAVRTAHSKGIPASVCLWAVPTPLDPYLKGVAYVDSIKGGTMIGDWLKANAKPGKTVVVEGVLGQGFSENLNTGLDAALAGSGFQVVVREQGYFDRTKATNVVQRALQAHPDITAIVDYAAAMGDGIASYLKQQNISHITHVTSDGDPEMLTWLGTPYLAASRYYSAAQTGVLGAQVVIDALQGKTVTFRNPVAQVMLTAQNKSSVIAHDPLDYPSFAGAASGA